MVTPEEVITRTLDPESALGSRDALAKTVYSRLFDWYDILHCVFWFQTLWICSCMNIVILVIQLACSTASRIVEKINRSIGQDPNSKSLIGVLDIYGFESFKQNR